MTQQEAADALGVHKNTLAMWERGEGRPDLYQAEMEEFWRLGHGWFAAHTDPIAKLAQMAEDVAAIRGLLEKNLKRPR